MSYILEALKKSDEKRRQGDVPDLQTVHMSIPVDTQQARWPYIVIIILLMGLVFLLGWMRPWQVSIQADPQIKRSAIEDKSVVAKTVQDEPVEVEKVAETRPVVIASSEPVTKKIIDNAGAQLVYKKQEAELQNVPHLEELPELLQKAIPDMSFAGHVYSSNPVQRSVIINGYAMGEGDMIVDGLRIEQITRKGVIFDYRSQLFRIDILQDWSFD